jgi:ankyrin repeat protein
MAALSAPNDAHQALMKLIFHSKLREMMEIVPTLPTLNFIDERGTTPLIKAIGAAEEEIVEYLLLRGADPNFADKQTLPLAMAIERSIENDKYSVDNDLESDEDPLAIVELLLLYGADFLKKDPTGESAYEFALKVHHPAKHLFEDLMQQQNPR